MSDGVMIGSECADWWDQQLRDYHKELEEYVINNPGFFGVCVATGKATAADFAHAYFVDLARMGEGAAEGGVKGIVQDLLRVMNFIPPAKVFQGALSPLGRLVQFIQNTRLWRQVQGNLCTPIAIAQALQRTGQKFAVGLGEIADALGVPLRTIYKSGVDHMNIGPALSKLGIDFATVPAVIGGKFDDLVRMAEGAAGPIIVRVKSFPQTGFEEVGHTILIGKTKDGIRIIDRSGFYRNLDELSKMYDVLLPWQIDDKLPMFIVKNAVIDESLKHLLNNLGILGILVRQSLGIFDFNRSQVMPDFVKQDFARFVAQRRNGQPKPPVQGDEIVVTGGKTIEVAKSDPNRATLSGIAKKEYGNWEFWPLLWDLNKDKIGQNPNRLTQGLKLLVLPLARYTAQEQADARRRAPTWKNYPL